MCIKATQYILKTHKIITVTKIALYWITINIILIWYKDIFILSCSNKYVCGIIILFWKAPKWYSGSLVATVYNLQSTKKAV